MRPPSRMRQRGQDPAKVQSAAPSLAPPSSTEASGALVSGLTEAVVEPAAAAGKEHEDVVTLLQALAPAVLSYLRRRTESNEDAADLLSKVLLVAWRRVEVLPREPEQARMWLFTVARNLVSNHHRGHRRAGDLTAQLRESLVAEEQRRLAALRDLEAAAATIDRLRTEVAQLPEVQRELVMLVHWEGMSLVQAAQLVGISASTARSRYARARTVLAERLRHLLSGSSVRPSLQTEGTQR